MSKYAVVYWSGTGNTKEMAEAVAEGVKQAGAEVDLLGANVFGDSELAKYDGVAFGCSAQGSEVLEEGTFQTMWDCVKTALRGTKIVLFGSYGWGGGEFMNIWEEDAQNSGATVLKTAISQEAPDSTGVEECKLLGKTLASS